MKQRWTLSLCGLALTVFGLVSTPHAAAQTTATVVGSVFDPSGAPVPGASVTVTNELTGLERTLSTSEDGAYLVNLLPPGTYSVTVSADGFKRTVREGIELTVGQNATVDVSLDVGAMAETVTVTSAAPLVDTRNATVANVMEEKRILELPLNGRSPASLLALIPGVTNVNPGSAPISQAVSANIAGGRDLGNSFTLDGGQWNNVQYPRGYPLPPPDMVEEFRVETNSYDASKGMASAGTVEATTKSGTNELHGALWEFLRNDDLNAKNYFAPTVPFLAQNQFGFAAGGPIKKNRTFFFGSYQGTRIREAILSNSAIPPTAAERQGDFLSSPGGVPIDPQTGEPFPGGVIPSDRWDPAAANVLNRLVAANTPDGRYSVLRSGAQDGDQFMARVDHLFGDRNRLSGRFWYSGGSRLTPQGDVEWASEQRSVDFRNLNISDTHTFSANLINEFRLSRATMLVQRAAVDTLFSSARDIGINLAPSEVEPAPPTIGVTGRFSAVGPLRGDCIQCDHFWDIRDTVSWIHGKHSFKIGGSFMPTLFGPTNVLFDHGGFTFSGQFTGNAMADFFIGAPSFFSSTRERENHRSAFFGAFFNDDYRVTRKLTLNLGLRYHYESPTTEKNGYSSTFVPGFQSTVFPDAPLGMFFAGDPGRNKALFRPDKNNLGPRFGFAWDPKGDGRTSIRGGYGIFFQSQLNGVSEYISLNQPFLPTFYLSTVNSFSDPLKGYVGGVVPGDPVETFNPETGEAVFNLPVSMLGAVPDQLPNPYVQQYSLSIQRQLPKAFLLDVAYVGNVGRKLQSAREFNPADYAPGATLANREQRRRYSAGMVASVPMFENVANTSYNSLQTSISKRFSAGYLFNANYTWSKSLDDTSGFYNLTQNPDLRSADWSLSDFHRAHVFTASWVWELPYFANLSGPAGVILRGWQLSGLVRLASGSPLKVITGRDNSLTAVGQDRPNVVGDPVLSGDRPTEAYLQRYFDPMAFAANPLGQFGNAGRNLLIGPGSATADLGVFKAFRITESQQLQVRAEVYNLTNRANFGNPTATFISPNFGRILSAGDARIVQLALKYKF